MEKCRLCGLLDSQLSTGHSQRLSVYLSVRLPISPSVCPSVCPSVSRQHFSNYIRVRATLQRQLHAEGSRNVGEWTWAMGRSCFRFCSAAGIPGILGILVSVTWSGNVLNRLTDTHTRTHTSSQRVVWWTTSTSTSTSTLSLTGELLLFADPVAGRGPAAAPAAAPFPERFIDSMRNANCEYLTLPKHTNYSQLSTH